MKALLFAALGAVSLAGCVSTEMRSYIGEDVSEARMRYGSPVSVFDLADGRRVFQFQQGGGTAVIPATGTTVARQYGNTAVVQSQATPATLVQNAPCLLTFITVQNGNSWTVQDIRVPKQLVC